MNPDFKISVRAQRAKSFDLRRKVLLKNFFRNQNVFIHNAASAAFESFDFSKHQFLQSEDGSYDSSDNSSECKDDEVPSSSVEKMTIPEANTPFTFTNMMTALPDSTTPTDNIDSIRSDISADPSDSDACQSVSSTQEMPECSKKRQKRFFKRPSLLRRCAYKHKTRKIARRTSSKRLSSKGKKSFKTKCLKFLKSNLTAKKKLRTKSNNSDMIEGKNDDFLQKKVKQNVKGSSVKCVAIQTEDCHPLDTCVKDSENHRLRLENKNLKNKVNFLLKLNSNDKPDICHDVSDLFESNQENKTGFNSSSRVTRSHSVHENNLDSNFYMYQKRCRRTRSACLPRNRLIENNHLCKHSAANQPFKPMQSFICENSRSRRKRRFSPSTIDRTLDYRAFVKRPRNLSLP